MKWSFSYGLRLSGKSISLGDTLRKAGVQIGSVIQININGRYEDLYEKELKEAFSPDKIYLMTQEILNRKQWLQEQVSAR
jgi:hypothetical protein